MIRRIAFAGFAASALLLAGCGGSSSPTAGGQPTAPTTTAPAGNTGGARPADVTAAKAQITANWQKFFSSSTSTADAVALLENGSSLGPALTKAQQEDRKNGGQRSAVVQKISFTSATQATVHYKLHAGKAPVLNAAGVAVYQGGQWKVSQTTFCTLVVLGNNENPVKGCQ